ncbi:hypothetical protein [Nodosilinea nodulosa]|uniref:hypothetical protein n=1 Tax=Nodosilinea nodulosa TaxID=416001 RepID=UPI00036D2C77|nr:hypothetical protein [Nodosilinea nodulosa]
MNLDAEEQKLDKSCDAKDYRQQVISRMVEYFIDEDFGPTHLQALMTLVTRMNLSEESEKEILEFAEYIKGKYSS